jgi:hypothetical protein
MNYARTEWIKTPSDTGACLEVGSTPAGYVAIRSTVNPGVRVLATQFEWDAFVQAVKNGHFDT